MSELKIRDFQAVAWDFDGVLADTLAAHTAARLQAYEVLAEERDDPRFVQIDPAIHAEGHNHGSHPEEINAWVLAAAGLIPTADISHPMVKEIVATKKDLYHLTAQRGLTPIPGALQLFRRFAVDRPAKQAIVTTAGPREVDPFVTHNGLNTYLTPKLIITGEHPDVFRKKPARDAYMVGGRVLGLKRAENMLVFEDSEQGIVAAKSYGAFVVAVATTRSYDKLSSLEGLQKPDLVVEDFAEAHSLFGFRAAA
ncbi:MAG: HAD family phosphatase [Candidatus Saccharimonadales bacterium]